MKPYVYAFINVAIRDDGTPPTAMRLAEPVRDTQHSPVRRDAAPQAMGANVHWIKAFKGRPSLQVGQKDLVGNSVGEVWKESWCDREEEWNLSQRKSRGVGIRNSGR